MMDFPEAGRCDSEEDHRIIFSRRRLDTFTHDRVHVAAIQGSTGRANASLPRIATDQDLFGFAGQRVRTDGADRALTGQRQADSL
jgi:hypothetical protein